VVPSSTLWQVIELKYLITLQAGAAAAFTIDLLVYPLDTIKTRLQSQDFVKTYASSVGKKTPPNLFRGLYQGVGSVIIATLPACMFSPLSSIELHRGRVE
jgi:hypothetical protein